MPHLAIDVPHQLGQEKAQQRLESKTDLLFHTFEGKISAAHSEWQGNTLQFGFSVMGARISGKLDVQPANVHVGVDLPLMAMMFKGPIQQKVREELEKVLS